MMRVRRVYFSQNPALESIVEQITTRSGLEVIVEYYGNSITVVNPEVFEEIEIHSVKKRIIGIQGVPEMKSDYIDLNCFTPERTYIEGLTLLILQNMGGEFEDKIELPTWTHARWQGKQWWEKVKTKPSILKKISRKLLSR